MKKKVTDNYPNLIIILIENKLLKKILWYFDINWEVLSIKSISKHIWPIVYGRRSSAQNVNGIVQIYQFTKILQNSCLRRNILENLGENISMLSDFEKCKVIDQIIVNMNVPIDYWCVQYGTLP